MANQEAGQAIRFASSTHFTKPLFRIVMILGTDAPKIFLIPISLVLLSAINEERPNKSRQDINKMRLFNNLEHQYA